MESTGDLAIAPTASVESVRTVVAGTRIDLRATTSPALGGGPLAYAWTLDAPAGSGVMLAATDLSRTCFFADAPGRYFATVTVSDGGASGEDILE